MVHVPVAKRNSYMYLYRFVSTPLKSPGGEFRMLVFPQSRVLSINKETHVAKEITEDYFRQCKAVGDGPRYCPKEPIQLTETSTTCLTGLYGNEMQIVVRSCPILHLNATQPYVCLLYTSPSPRDS